MTSTSCEHVPLGKWSGPCWKTHPTGDWIPAIGLLRRLAKGVT